MCNEVENLFERYNEAKKELEYHKKEAKRLEEEVERHNEAKKELEYHKKEAGCLEEEVEYLEWEIRKMRDGFSKLAGEKMDEKDERIEELEGTVAYYYTAFTKLINVKRDLMEKVNEQSKLIKKLENEKRISISSNLIDEVLDNRKKIEELNRQIMELRGEIDNLRIDNKSLCEDIEKAEKRMYEKDKQIEQLKNEIDSHKESTKHDNDEISKLQDALKEKVERIKALEPLGAIDVHELLKDYRSFNDEIKELREENDYLKRENKSLKREVDIWKDSLEETKIIEDEKKRR